MLKRLRIIATVFLFFSMGASTAFSQTVMDCVSTENTEDCESTSFQYEVSDVAAIVNTLRTKLEKEQIAFLEEFARGGGTDKSQAPINEEYVKRLRNDLRKIVLEQSLVSGDVDLALRKATIRFLTERIAAYEAAYGQNDGAFTTRYNVLTDADLTRLEEQIKTRLREILTETAAIAESDISIKTQGHIVEIRRELEALRFERTSRNSGAQDLVSIANTPTASNPNTAIAAIKQAESSQMAERALFVEIERRAAWNPDDAALNNVKHKLRSGPFRKYYIALIEKGTIWRSGWPPSRGPPPGAPSLDRGSPPNPIKPSGGGAAIAIEQVREGIAREIDAIIKRDPLGRAEAAARWNVASQWLNDLVGAKNSGWRSALAVLSETELRNYLGALQDWKYALVRGDSGINLPDWQRSLEDRFVDDRLAMLRSEISIRGPPSPGPGEGPKGHQAMLRAAEQSYGASTIVPYDEYAQTALENRRLVELQKLEAVASTVDKVAIKEAIDIQLPRALNARSKTISEAYTAASEAERVAFVYGRGREGVLTAIRYGDSKQLLRGLGDSLHQQMNEMTTNGVLDSRVVNTINADLPTRTTENVFIRESISLRDLSNLVKNGSRSLPQPQITIASKRLPLAEARDTLRFDRQFTVTGPNSAKAFRNNPILAPGGVIVDLMLPRSLSERLKGIQYNSDLKQFIVNIEGKWIPVGAEILPQIARAALGFVFDRRVAAIDIGGFDKEVRHWMVLKNIIPDTRTLSFEDKESLKKIESLLRIVRSNPAVADTEIAHSLIAADELIFTALRLEPVILAKHSVFRGIDTIELHELLRQDKAEIQATEASSGYKSVLSVDNVKVISNEDGLHVHPKFDYAVYVGDKKLERVSQWFNRKDDELRRASPELRLLERFSIAVALIRSAVHVGIEDGLNSLVYVYDPGQPSSSLICRSDIPVECQEPFIKQLTDLGLSENMETME